MSRKVISVQNESLVSSKKELISILGGHKASETETGRNQLNANQFIDFKVMENFMSFDQEKRKNYSVVSADTEAFDLNHQDFPKQTLSRQNFVSKEKAQVYNSN